MLRKQIKSMLHVKNEIIHAQRKNKRHVKRRNDEMTC